MSILAMLVHIVVLIFSILSADSISAAAPPRPDQYGSIPTIIFSSYTLENSTAQTLHKVEFLAYAPVKRMTYQQCIGLMSSHPNTLKIDEFGNQIVRFVYDTIPPFAKKIISVHAEILLNNGAGWPMTIEPSIYLQPARYIEVRHEKIIRTARTLSSPDPMKTAEKIYRFVSDHVRSDGYASGEYGALYALEQGRGDCTESMYLFVALCRAAGIPARCIGGYTLGGSTVLRSSRYHNWAEFHDRTSWRITDPQQKVFAQNRGDYLATKVLHDFPEHQGLSFHRFYTGEDRVKVRMNE